MLASDSRTQPRRRDCYRWRWTDGVGRRRTVALLTAVPLALMTLGLALVLGSAAPRLAASNSQVAASGRAVTIGSRATVCQDGEYVPADAHSIRLYAGVRGRAGGPLRAVFTQAGHLPFTGRAARVVRTAPVELPLSPRSGTLDAARACFTNLGSVPLSLAGNRTPLSQNVRAAPGPEGVRIDYLRASRPSWWSQLPAIARRFALFKVSFFGAWTMWALAALVAVVAVVSLALAVRPRLRAACAACATVGALNAGVWALATPPFQAPDEPEHAAYVQFLAESGRAPRPLPETYFKFAPEEQAAFDGVPFSVEGRPSWSPGRARAVRRELRRALGRRYEPGADQAALNPPLYYAWETLAYGAARNADFLDRLVLMRLFSALLAGLTTAFCFLFLRELLPRAPRLWLAGGLAVAFQPLFGFVSGAVSPDAGLYAASAALLWLIARAFRRAPSRRLLAALALTVLAGVLMKRAFVVMVPPAAIALAIAFVRRVTDLRLRRLAGAPAALGVVLAPLALIAAAYGRAPGDVATGGFTKLPVAAGVTTTGQLEYVWQFFLPRLPFMQDQLPAYSHFPVWDVYLQGFVGRFGWFEFGFPAWGYLAALTALAALAALAARAAWHARAALRRRAIEGACYVAIAASLLLAIATVGYRYRVGTGHSFEQARYLLPLLGLYGAAIALAARGAGERFARLVAVAIVFVAVVQSAAALMLSVAHYYG